MKKNKVGIRITIVLVGIALLVGIAQLKRLERHQEVAMVEIEVPVVIRGVVFTPESGEKFNTLEPLTQLEEEMGFDVQFTQVTNSKKFFEQEYMSHMQEVPDFIMGGEFQNTDIYSYIKSGTIRPLDDLIEKYAPNIKRVFEEKPIIKKYCTYEDGKVYTLPFYNQIEENRMQNYLFINKTWLDTLNLQIPTTTEEFYKVLQAFKSQDPNQNGREDEIPFSYIEGIPRYNIDNFMGAFGVVSDDKYLMIQDDKISFVPIDNRTKTGITYLKKLYGEGLIDAEVFTQNLRTYTEKGHSEEMILGAFIAKDSATIVGDGRAQNDYMIIPPLKGPEGDQLWGCKKSGVTSNQFMMTTYNAYPEKTIAWIDQFFNEETAIPICTALKGAEFAGPGILTEKMHQSLSCLPAQMARKNHYGLYNPYTVKEKICLFAQGDEEYKELESIYHNISKYIAEYKIRWISGSRDIEIGWDHYVKALEEMGTERYVEIYQEIHDECQRATKHHW